MGMARNQVWEHKLVTPLLERKRLEEAVWMNRELPVTERLRLKEQDGWCLRNDPEFVLVPTNAHIYLCVGNPTTTECTCTYMNKTATRT